MAKLSDKIASLERRVGRKRAAHEKLVARIERTQRRMIDLATALQQAETALGEAVAQVAASTEAKATRRRQPAAAPSSSSNGKAQTKVPARTTTRRRSASPEAATAPAPTTATTPPTARAPRRSRPK